MEATEACVSAMDSKSSQISSLVSISANHLYSNKSFEELRHEDYARACHISNNQNDVKEKSEHTSGPLFTPSLTSNNPDTGKWNFSLLNYSSGGNDVTVSASCGKTEVTLFPELQSGKQTYSFDTFSQPAVKSQPGMGAESPPATSVLEISKACSTAQIKERQIFSFSDNAGMYAPVSNPFGLLAPLERLSLKSTSMNPFRTQDTCQSIMSECSFHVKKSSFMNFDHISPRRKLQLRARKYFSEKQETKLSFLDDAEPEISLIPRQNPRALLIDKDDSSRSTDDQVHKQADRNTLKPSDLHGIVSLEIQDVTDEHAANEKDESAREFTEVVSEHIQTQSIEKSAIQIPDNKVILPTLQSRDYYTEPSLEELAAKERSDPGSSSRVHNFVVGRTGFGSIEFPGKSCVRGLNLENIIQINQGEVLVYMNESSKPPVGQGLNKPAVITLLNVHCICKETGQVLYDGVQVQKFENKLKMLTAKQGAEFLSYNGAKGEWKIKVEHF